MGHAHPYVQRRIDARRDGALYIAARIVEQHFIVPDLNADRGQGGQISITGEASGFFGWVLPR